MADLRDGRSLDVADLVERWEGAGLVDHEQAEAILAFERGADEAPGRRVPYVTEVLGYVGVALVIASVATLLGRIWEDLARPAQLGSLAVGTLLFLAAGWMLRRSDEPAIGRLAGVLWTVSAGGLALFLATLFVVDVERPAAWVPVVIGAIVAVYTWVLLAMRASSALQLALAAATLAAVFGAGAWAIDLGWTWLREREVYAGAAALAVVSAAWIAAGVAGVLRPRATATALGAIGLVFAPQFLFEESVGAGLVSGAIVAAALLALATPMRSMPTLAIGAVALFGYVTGSSLHFLGDTAGLPVALLVAGLLVVGVAVLTVRVHRTTFGDGDAPPALQI